ncbi:MAG: creatininase family protein [Anaerolineae bacterium]
MRVLLTEMSWPEAEQRLAAGALAVLPLASTEQHGPHLPLSTDATIVSECVHRAALVAEDIPILVAPTLTVGFSEHHMDFPGTLTLQIPTFIAAVTDICESLIRHGCRKLLLINGHGGNHELAQVVVRQVMSKHRVVIGAASYWDVAREALLAAGGEAVGLIPGHSAGFETACMLALRPELVHLEALPSGPQSEPGATAVRRMVRDRGVMSAPHAEQHADSGVWGDPALVRPDLGAGFVAAITASLAALFRTFAATDSY